MNAKPVIGVVGAGTMGAGIAYTAALHGYPVVTVDTDPAVARKALAVQREAADRRVESGKLSSALRDATFARLEVGDGLSSLKKAHFVIEAVIEDLAIKRKLFGELDRLCPPPAVLATNTSSLSVSAIAAGAAHPQRVLGMHFFNPPQAMPLVEVIAGAATGSQAVTEAVALVRALNKTPVKALDRPGFIANRVARPFYLESLALLERGVSDVAGIDAAICSAGYPMGPFELLDLIGLDVNLAVTQSVYDGFSRPKRFAPSPIQQKLVSEGRLGRKTGRGFYDYAATPPTLAFETPTKGLSPSALRNEAFVAFAHALEREPNLPTWLFARVVSAVINEAALTAGDKTALPRDIDLAMTLGLRFPDGPITFADHVGLDIVLNLMQAFDADDASERHRPAPLLVQHVNAGELGEKSAAGFLWHSL